jgi:hypothetical protein
MELIKLKAFGAVLQMENDTVFDSELFSNQMFAKLVTDCLILICGKLRQSRDTLRDHRKAWLISQSFWLYWAINGTHYQRVFSAAGSRAV